jgi:hypothetical protein
MLTHIFFIDFDGRNETILSDKGGDIVILRSSPAELVTTHVAELISKFRRRKRRVLTIGSIRGTINGGLSLIRR